MFTVYANNVCLTFETSLEVLWMRLMGSGVKLKITRENYLY